MVSTFLIQTDIYINPEFVDAFNEWVCTFEVHACEDLVPEFFDRIWGDPLTELPRFVQSNQAYRHLQYATLHNVWAARESGQLYTRITPSYGAVSMFSYMIDAFFKPRGIQLHGTIVGVNRAYPMVYIYKVENNQITLCEQATRSYIEEYEGLTEEDRADRIFRTIRNELDLDFELDE